MRALMISDVRPLPRAQANSSNRRQNQGELRDGACVLRERARVGKVVRASGGGYAVDMRVLV